MMHRDPGKGLKLAQNCVNPEMHTPDRVLEVTGFQIRLQRIYGHIRIRINLLQILIYLDTGFPSVLLYGSRAMMSSSSCITPVSGWRPAFQALLIIAKKAIERVSGRLLAKGTQLWPV